VIKCKQITEQLRCNGAGFGGIVGLYSIIYVRQSRQNEDYMIVFSSIIIPLAGFIFGDIGILATVSVNMLIIYKIHA
jgi:hypothetical protein